MPVLWTSISLVNSHNHFRQISQKAYDLLGLRAEWTDASKRFTVAAYGDNITNAKYFTQVIPHVAAPAANWAAPRSWGVSLSVRY